LQYFYPTSVIVPAYDIIPFWVARMIMMGLKFMDDIPFDDVFIHGLIRDEKGRKMSKSLGNGVDPLDVIEQYGADALRLVMVHGVSQESDIRWSESKILAARNFANKLWNAARFVFMQLPDDFDMNKAPEMSALMIEDKWILSKYNRLVKEVTANLDTYNLGVAVGKVHDFIWNVYCDWYIELSKPHIKAGGEAARNTQGVLLFVMKGMLKLLHPFMPFISEEIYASIESNSIMVSKFPEWDSKLDFADDEAEFDKTVEAIKEERAAKQSQLDKEKELIRLTKELEKAKKDIEFIEAKLANEGFVTKAPPAQVENERTKLTNARERLSGIEKSLEALK